MIENDASNLIDKLGQIGNESSFGPLIESLGSVALPGLDDDDEAQHYDWVLIRKKGIELGFADAAYFNGRPQAFWRKEGLVFNQVTFYSDSREGVTAFTGRLPFALAMSDSRPQVREKLATHEASRRSYLTDCWDIEGQRWVIAYTEDKQGIDSVHVKLSIRPLDEAQRLQPKVSVERWFTMFGRPADDPELLQTLSPLDLLARIEENEDEREVDFISECGLELYFEETRRLQLPSDRLTAEQKALVFGAVKFFRARDLEAREYLGDLPFALDFNDSPSMLAQKVGAAPTERRDGKLTGHAIWHLEDCSLQVLYSVIENHLFRITLMAPGYWRDIADSG